MVFTEHVAPLTCYRCPYGYLECDFSPPLVIAQADLAAAIAIVDECVEDEEATGPP